MVSFGQKEKDSSGFDGDVWIMGFKDGDTRVRWLEEVDDWHKYFEHYDPDVLLPGNKRPGAYFGCAKKALGECEGCNSPVERVAKANVKWAVWGVNDKGYAVLYKVGSTIKKAMSFRTQREGSCRLRDFVINKSGKALDTEYQIDPQEKSDRDTTEAESKTTDAGEIVAKTYFDYVKAKQAEPEFSADDAPEPETDDGDVTLTPAPEDKSDEAQADIAQEDAPVTEAPKADGFVKPEQRDPNSLPTPEIKSILDTLGVDYGKAPRSRLIAILQNWQSENPPF